MKWNCRGLHRSFWILYRNNQKIKRDVSGRLACIHLHPNQKSHTTNTFQHWNLCPKKANNNSKITYFSSKSKSNNSQLTQTQNKIALHIPFPTSCKTFLKFKHKMKCELSSLVCLVFELFATKLSNNTHKNETLTLAYSKILIVDNTTIFATTLLAGYLLTGNVTHRFFTIFHGFRWKLSHMMRDLHIWAKFSHIKMTNFCTHIFEIEAREKKWKKMTQNQPK